MSYALFLWLRLRPFALFDKIGAGIQGRASMTEKSCVEILTIIRKIHKMKEELEDLEKRLRDFQESIKTKKPP